MGREDTAVSTQHCFRRTGHHKSIASQEPAALTVPFTWEYGRGPKGQSQISVNGPHHCVHIDGRHNWIQVNCADQGQRALAFRPYARLWSPIATPTLGTCLHVAMLKRCIVLAVLAQADLTGGSSGWAARFDTTKRMFLQAYGKASLQSW